MAPKESEFKSRLKKLSGVWKKAKEEAEQAPTFASLPEGRYLWQVTDAELNTSKGGRFQMYIELTVREGDQSGDTCRKYWGLDKVEHLKYLIQDLARLGYDVENPEEDLPAVVADLCKKKPQVRGRVVVKGEYLNVYLDKVVRSEEEEEAAPEAEAEEKPAKASKKEEAPAEEAAADEVVIEKGTRLHVTENAENGEVVAIDEEAAELTIKLDSGKKVIVGLDGVEAEKEPEPAPKKGLRVSRK